MRKNGFARHALIETLHTVQSSFGYLDDDAMALVMDRDVCLSTLSASHDMHIGKILKREDEARVQETKRYQDCISSHTNTERARNRDRILQIHDLCRSTKASLSALLSMDDDDGGYDDDLAAL